MSIKFQKFILNSKAWTPPVNREKSVKLDLNENYDIFDNNFLKKLNRTDSFVISCYPEYDKLTGLIGRYCKQANTNIAITNGAEQAIELTLRLFFNEKSTVIIPSPVFFRYDNIFNLLGIKAKHIFYKVKNGKFIFPIAETLKKMEKSSGVILCNPNNPLGSSINDKDIIKIIKRSKELNIPCIIDEAYFEFYGKTSSHLVKKFDNLIIIRTFSKAFGLAGLRLGYIIASTYVIEQVVKIRGPRDVNHFAVKAGEIVLQNIKYFQNKLAKTLKTKHKLISFLRENDFEVYNTNTNFILMKYDESDNLVKKLQENNILVNSVSDYPFSNNILNKIIRITIPSDKDFKTLKYFFSSYRK